MEHVKALIIKFIMCTAILWIVLGLFYGAGFGDIVAMGVILTFASYLIGDLYVLPAFGNTAATIVDLILVFFGVWLLGAALIEQAIPLVAASLISAIGVAIGEAFFHRYMKQEILDDKGARERRLREDDNVATEFAEENNIYDMNRNDNRDKK